MNECRYGKGPRRRDQVYDQLYHFKRDQIIQRHVKSLADQGEHGHCSPTEASKNNKRHNQVPKLNRPGLHHGEDTSHYILAVAPNQMTAACHVCLFKPVNHLLFCCVVHYETPMNQ